MARWITVRSAFDYRWPGRNAVTEFNTPGEFMVKDEVADFAIAKGFATEGKAEGSTTRSVKGKTRRRRAAKVAEKGAATVEASNAGPVPPVADADAADADRAADRSPVDQPAG